MTLEAGADREEIRPYIPSSIGSLVAAYSVGNAGQTLTGNNFNYRAQGPEYSYSVNIPALTLTGGAEYWLGVTDNTSSSVVWNMEQTTMMGDAEQYEPALNMWAPNPFAYAFAFELTGPNSPSPVPEPASVTLLGLGAYALFRVRWHRRSN